MASGSGWNLWVWLLGVVVRRCIDFFYYLSLLPLYLFFFTAASLLFVHLKNVFHSCSLFCNYILRSGYFYGTVKAAHFAILTARCARAHKQK